MNGTPAPADAPARRHTNLLDELDAPVMDFTIGPAPRRRRVDRRLRRFLP